jgi:hypothetical protein
MEIKDPSMKEKKRVANSIKLDVCANRVKAPKAKRAIKKLSLGDAIHQADSMPLKTKPVDVKAMYKTLKEGLRGCFPYIQDPIPATISATWIHLASNTMKYRMYFEKHMEKIQLEHITLSVIRKKLELYYVSLKKLNGD